MSLYLKFFINGVTFVPFHYDIEASSSQLKRFNDSVIDPESLLKIEATFCLITFYPFSNNIKFSCLLLFLFEKYFRFKCFPKWFGITINTKLLKVLPFGLYIQIFQQVLLSLKLDKVTRIFWLICLNFEIWSDHYLLPKVRIKIGFLIPS